MQENLFLSAEIGINHNGDIDLAKKMIDVAVIAGCNAVKFQKRTVEEVYTQAFLDSPRESMWGKTQRDQKNGLEFSEQEYDVIDQYCKEKGIYWFASSWDVNSQLFLRKYDLKYNKIASPVLVNIPLLEAVAEEGRMTFISTGMSTDAEIDTAVEVFTKASCPFEVVHCVSIYPAQPQDVNLLSINTLRERYGVAVGYSTHELGNIGAMGAVALGASSIERHITLDRSLYGSDQSSSVEPDKFIAYCRDLKVMRAALGIPERIMTENELLCRKKMRS